MKGFKFLKEKLEKPSSFWERVAWSNELKFNVFGPNGKVMVWRTLSEEPAKKSKYLLSNMAVT